jgi:fatty-acyl-CoA synthase
MQDFPLTLRMIFDHGAAVHSRSEVVTYEGATSRRASYGEVAERAGRVASALKSLGVQEGDRVGTLMWNNQEHLEVYLAVPTMGAVLHTLNLRLFPDQLSYVINHAGDKVIVIDDTLVGVLARVIGSLTTLEHVIVVGPGDASVLQRDVLRYEELLANASPNYAWPDLDERSAMAMCYTTGTTGDPKGVVYSHRSTVLHTLACLGCLRLDDSARILPIVPMFHANAWGLPYDAWFLGADLIMPGRFLQAEPLARLIEQEKVTYAAAVPTIWADVLRYGEEHEVDFSSLEFIVCGGSAVPRSLMERFEERFGTKITQAWGMTEMNPAGAVGWPPKGISPEEEMDWRVKQGRIVPGVQMRIVDDNGSALPWDGKALGEVEVRGPWITAGYYNQEAPDNFHDGWLRTGDVGHIDDRGYLMLTDRAKDVIKSGGEWISSVEVENTIMAHPGVAEAAVIGVPDPRWDERPLAFVVLREGATHGADELRSFLEDKVAKWWLPERWTFVPEVPKTSVGKFDKKVLRTLYQEGKIEVVEAH